MKLSNWTHVSAVALLAASLAACNNDRHGSAAVPRTANFVGLWMSDAAHRDVQQTLGDLNRFCGVATANPTRHGLNRKRLDLPSTPILEIVPGGTVFRWVPNLSSTSPDFLNKMTVGRIDSAGVQAMAGYSDLKLGTLRFSNFDHLDQIDGDDLFPAGRIAERGGRNYAANPEFDAYVRSAKQRRGFTRVDRGFAEMYLSQLCNCDPDNFSRCSSSGRPAAAPATPSREPAPVARETPAPTNRRRPISTPSWSETPAAPDKSAGGAKDSDAPDGPGYQAGDGQ